LNVGIVTEQTELDSSLYSSFPSEKARNKGQNEQDCSFVTLFTIVLLYTYVTFEADKRRQMTKHSQASNVSFFGMIYDTTYLLTAIELTPGDSSTVHIYTQTIHRTTQITALIGRLSGIRTQSGQTNWEECGPCPVFASYTLAFGSELRKKRGKTKVRVFILLGFKNSFVENI
jgi:hypothetical protein